VFRGGDRGVHCDNNVPPITGIYLPEKLLAEGVIDPENNSIGLRKSETAVPRLEIPDWTRRKGSEERHL
jgi:hypothetical protein